MVVNMNTTNRQSIHADKNEAKAAASDLKTYRPIVQEGIKSRADSFIKLQKAAAASLYFFALHGSPTLLNELYAGLGLSDRDGFRNLFLYRAFDLIGEEAGGIRGENKTVNGVVVSTWKERPVLPIAFKAKANEGEWFEHAKVPNNDTTGKSEKMKAAKAAIAALGFEGLSEISWQKRDPKLAKPAPTIDGRWARNQLSTALLKIAKIGAKAEISLAQIIMASRALGLHADDVASFTDAYAKASEAHAITTQSEEIIQPETETESTGETEKQPEGLAA